MDKLVGNWKSHAQAMKHWHLKTRIQLCKKVSLTFKSAFHYNIFNPQFPFSISF